MYDLLTNRQWWIFLSEENLGKATVMVCVFFELIIWCVCFSNLPVIFLSISIADFPGCKESGEGNSGELRSFNLAAWTASLFSSLAIY